jgi:hypothetical protein
LRLGLNRQSDIQIPNTVDVLPKLETLEIYAANNDDYNTRRFMRNLYVDIEVLQSLCRKSESLRSLVISKCRLDYEANCYLEPMYHIKSVLLDQVGFMGSSLQLFTEMFPTLEKITFASITYPYVTDSYSVNDVVFKHQWKSIEINDSCDFTGIVDFLNAVCNNDCSMIRFVGIDSGSSFSKLKGWLSQRSFKRISLDYCRLNGSHMEDLQKTFGCHVTNY